MLQRHCIISHIMEKINSLNQVGQFHSLFGAPILETPQIPSDDRCNLRVTLLQEELNELVDAISNNWFPNLP